MQSDGVKLIRELKKQVLSTMAGIKECSPNGHGCRGNEIEDLSGLKVELPAQNGWITWSILVSLAQENKVESIKRGRSNHWRLKQ